MTQEPPIVTIEDWKVAQLQTGTPNRLLSLIELERHTNPDTKTWISLATPHQIESQWQQLQLQKQTLSEADITKQLPLYGVPFAVKDNIDVQGFPTTAACPAFTNVPATTDAPVVARLKAAGAIVIGKTNMDQFATGLVGTRSPHGAPPNSFDESRISGGSSSGSGVVVGRATVPFSLGTDTAGSGRVPAGLNNVVGLKPTRGALSARGVLPACRTLDCVSIFALMVDDAKTVLAVAEGYDAEDSYSRFRSAYMPSMTLAFNGTSKTEAPSLAICSNPEWFGRDHHHAAYDAALDKARHLGWNLVPVDFSTLFKLAKLLYEGPWVAERYAAIKTFIESVQDGDLDPTVCKIVSKANSFSAVDAFTSEYERQDLAREIEVAFRDFDAILVPTTPTFPTIEQVQADPVGENSILGTYTNFVNFLDWSAIAIPAGFRHDGLPFGITLISGTWQEDRLLKLSERWLSDGPRRLGSTQVYRTEGMSVTEAPNGEYVSIAVVGAHLTEFPLNKDLTLRGGRFHSSTRTSRMYRLYALDSSSKVRKPGLKRVTSPKDGCEIELEVWDLPSRSVGGFLETIPHPLGLGSVELQDGRWIRGFICEPVGLEDAKDVSQFGGWRSYTEHLKRLTQPDEASTRRGISRVLIANRGEIAVRIIRTLNKMNIEAVSIYSEADAIAPHVQNANISLRLEGDSVADTYLNGSQILNLAKSVEADAIIPGYGFLSENAEFAEAVEAAGLIWVGPTPQQICDLGLKHRAREIANAARVPVIPGSPELVTSLDQARSEAERIGFPLMIKSTAGGGGIGLRQCQDHAGLEDAFDAVQRLAIANFGDSGVFLEKFVQNARHVEVQIIGDGKGRIIAAGERDCSLQRRHQKVIEESPAFAVPDHVRRGMREAAARLASSVKYRNVGTVEFIYDVDTQAYFFLEVNTRLQVEHPVTEAVTGLDLVECMVRVAGSAHDELFQNLSEHVSVNGASIEVRVYAENPLQNFQPCSGTVTNVSFPSTLRVDTWICPGTHVSSKYDPLLAKLIATGHDRQDALTKLADGLAKTEIHGVETNLEYLRQIVSWSLFNSGDYTTKSLDSFVFVSPSIQVLEPGALTTIQDYPGRTGYWNVGIPPSGPMDHLSFRLANRLIHNSPDAAALECTLQGPTLKFHCDTVATITGGEAEVTLDMESVVMGQEFSVKAGQVLNIGSVITGYRVYLAVAGGFDVPAVFGSRATFELGSLGGKEGTKLQRGDIVPLGSNKDSQYALEAFPVAPQIPIPQQPRACWTVGVIPGPHGAPDYFTHDGLDDLLSGEWHVHHNSNRMGIRLTGPKPQWARQTGGEAGLHPSNIHDSPYSIGSVSFTGDEAVMLTCDGPSLGGFVVFCVVASAEMWKLGQLRPGDSVRLQRIDTTVAIELNKSLAVSIDDLADIPILEDFLLQHDSTPAAPIVGEIQSSDGRIVARQAGDCAMILEFGNEEVFDIHQSLEIHAFCQQFGQTSIPGIQEATPGVRTVHVIYAQDQSPQTVLDRLSDFVSSYVVPSVVSSRTLHLPLAFDDSVSQAAVNRYAATIRSEAPWLPSNVEFLERLNGVDSISNMLYGATFLVLGLGDVFLGSPCAVPLDPRHRLFGTKYNPSRSFTPRRSVGIGGQYMCIYATDSPGGYQLVGRTVDIWDSSCFSTGTMQPWLFQTFDRIKFYQVDEAELDSKAAAELIKITEGTFDLTQYEAWVEANKDDIAAVAAHREKSISTAPFLDELCRPYQPTALTTNGTNSPTDSGVHFGGEDVKAMMPGKCYKFLVKENDVIGKGDILVSDFDYSSPNSSDGLMSF